MKWKELSGLANYAKENRRGGRDRFRYNPPQPEMNKEPPVFTTCNVCGRSLMRDDELAVGACAICMNEEIP